ncbi:carbon monoxide dehydrogenase subunit G [Aeromicrobium panaciterrae]|uniref:Carbon monoxide dehydrogenase subunit G n=1 Tax=Aeromicrobium panaciterrae TaxID=363861 RepID=A0ABU1UP44_9ACTN|nr:SRPBCC family protein [Aeromicrobium panaciterrae]MDR7086951.1 carbon monoxide dehydrogenase subunit G [Aeromicrobium panaciterrae]
MAEIEIVREVRLSAEEAWRRVTDWPAHGRFVPLTKVTRTADGFVARTGVGPIGFDDPMDVVTWNEPSFCRLEKRGRIVKGWAELSVVPNGEGSRVTWREEIRVTGVPRIFDWLVRRSSARLFSRVMDGLLS